MFSGGKFMRRDKFITFSTNSPTLDPKQAIAVHWRPAGFSILSGRLNCPRYFKWELCNVGYSSYI